MKTLTKFMSHLIYCNVMLRQNLGNSLLVVCTSIATAKNREWR